MMLTVNLYEDFIDEESVTVPIVFPLQSSGVNGSELNTPEANRFPADSDASLCE
jgi:hypothetical protein